MMHSDCRVGQISAMACLVLSAGVAGAAESELTARQVARQLAGEWEGQIEVRSVEGAISASVASMSARLGRHGSLEVYYEGFAFGEAGEGGLIFSAGDRPNDGTMVVYDEFLGIEASARGSTWHDADEPGSEEVFRMAGRSESRDDEAGKIRAEFRRISAESWEIEVQSQTGENEWQTALTLRMDRLPEGQVSAAAANMDSSVSLAALRNDAVVAGVESDD